MDREEAVARAAAVTGLSPQDVEDLLAAAEDPAALEAIISGYYAAGRGPDRTGWQSFEALLGTVGDIAMKVAPIVQVAMAIAPLL